MGFQFTEAFNEAATNDDIYSRCAAPAVHHEPRNEILSHHPQRFAASPLRSLGPKCLSGGFFCPRSRRGRCGRQKCACSLPMVGPA